MANWKKLAQGAAGAAAGGAALNVEDVFSTYLWNYASGSLTVSNGIDLAGEGGLVWIKGRTSNYHWLHDSERTLSQGLHTNTSDKPTTNAGSVTSFNSDGFTTNGPHSGSVDHASWTFRKAPKFFDVVTYTGDSTSGRTVSHNLGSVPAMIIIKRLDLATNWAVYHRSMGDGVGGGADENYYMQLNNTNARNASSAWWNNTAPTSTEFTLGNGSNVNGVGSPFVAYLFAHNDGDGNFGPTGDQDIIKCGSYTGTGSNGNFVDLGFEPQWVMVKRTNSTGNWIIVDNMRSLSHSDYAWLYPNTSDAESAGASSTGLPSAEATGFTLNGSSIWMNASGSTYIYVAIRRGPMAVPESATDVFAIDTRGTTGPAFNAGFPIDAALYSITNITYDKVLSSRLTDNKVLHTSDTGAESTFSAMKYDYQEGYHDTTSVNSNIYSWMWKRAPNFFDVVAWQGSSASTRTLNHNLGIAPEMIWAKNRNDTDPWYCYHTATGNTKSIPFSTSTPVTSSAIWNNTTPSATTFSVGNNLNWSTSFNYIAYLFATVAGVSKVGSYTGTSATQTIDCGFSSGARFVLIKEISGAGNWYLFDTERGITSTSNDGVLQLNSTAAELSESAYGYDMLQPHNSGFTLTAAGNAVNFNGADFIFYAVA